MEEGSKKHNRIIWLQGKCSYIAIISKDFVKENLGDNDITDVTLEVTDSGLLIKKNENRVNQ